MTNVVDDVWECAVEWSMGIERGMVVFHRQVTEVTELEESVLGKALATELNDLATVATTNHCGDSTLVVCATARRIPPAEPTRLYVDFGAQTPVVGTVSVPSQANVLLSMYPDPGGEIKSGRNFIPFLDSAKQTAGQILEASEAAIKSDFATFLFDQIVLAVIAELGPVLYRYATDILPPVIVEITDIVLRPMLASQRRRVQHHQPFG